MSHITDIFTLPDGTKELCFDKNEFMKKTFTVDEFLQENRNAANLETMRDDLGIYLKVLRSAMIELINKDYADFVNLSANLIGLDQAISGIQTPLGQLKEEVLLVKMNLTDAMNELNNCLEQRKHLRELKSSLQNLSRIQNSIFKLCILLKINSEDEIKLDTAILERAASEFNELQFSMSRCNHLTQKHRETCDKISKSLIRQIDTIFLQDLKNKQEEPLIRCLRIYVSLGKTSEVEELFRKDIIAPALHNIISESSLHSNPRGLQGIYSQILSFIDLEMKQILSITQSIGNEPAVKGFNFIINSFWPEVEMRLETHMSSIFAPGNPEMFFQKYSDTNEFLNTLETVCGTQVCAMQLRNHPQYKTFQQRWNLPVYFQIRFQEIGGSLETVCAENICVMDSMSNNFKLLQSNTTWNCLLKCWTSGVFLVQLSHRFWKLSLQILSRFHTWALESLQHLNKPLVNAETKQAIQTQHNNVDLLVFLYTDILNLSYKLPEFFETVQVRLNYLSEINKSILKSTLNESNTLLLSLLPEINKLVIQEISIMSLVHIKQVSDIPRLFRKTNREIPNKPCPYVALILETPTKFYQEYSKALGSDVVATWSEMIFTMISEQLYSSITEVLTSVQKTEESLRRLKQIRDRSGTINVTEKSGTTDDDKIRLQLQVDVLSYSSGIESLGLNKNHIGKLRELLSLVEDATKIRISDTK